MEQLERLRVENRQLRQARASHAVVDQAIGVLTVLGQLPPCDGFTVLREVSQHTNIKLAKSLNRPSNTVRARRCPTSFSGNCTQRWPARPPHALSDWGRPASSTGAGVRRWRRRGRPGGRCGR
ncbi:ANTAR domain-containing protein [Streptomyces sp. NPDC048252]|uniref:ANTAR domain-containing protein n=1 Tax=Streptomyces sp. NPDC048252 TaxID=3154612 RepID=UPI00341655DF